MGDLLAELSARLAADCIQRDPDVSQDETILSGMHDRPLIITHYPAAVTQVWAVEPSDVAWGIVLTAVTAACGLFAARLGN